MIVTLLCYYQRSKRTLPKEGVAFLDQKDPKSTDELLDAMEAFQAIRRRRRPNRSRNRTGRADSGHRDVSTARNRDIGLMNVG